MKLLDLNLLVYASDELSTHFDTAGAWLDTAMNRSETLLLPTVVTVGFIRLTTNPRIFRTPLASVDAVAAVRTWLDRPNVVVPVPGARHYDLIQEMLDATGVGGNLVTDAHLAAFAAENGATLVSYDNDFSRFPGITWESPAGL